MPSAERVILENRSELDLVAVIDTVLKNRWTILLSTVCLMLVGTAWAFFAHPQYRADMLVQIEDKDSPQISPSDIAALFDIHSSAAAEAQILASRLVVSRSVDRLRLYIDATPKRFALVGDFISRFNRGIAQPGVLGIGGYAWGQERVDIARFDVPRDLEDDSFDLTLEAGGRYRLSGSDLDVPVTGRVGVESVFDTANGPITLSVAGFEALPGTRFTLIRHSRMKTIDTLQRALDVQEKVKQSGVIVATLADRDPDQVSRTLQEIGAQYVRQNLEQKSAEAAQSLSFLDSQLPTLKKRLEEAEQRYTTLRDTKGTFDLSEEAKLALQQSAESAAQLLMLQQKRVELATRFNSAHPGIVAIDQQIAALRRQQGLQRDKLRQLPDLEQDTVRLMLDVKVNRDLYTALLADIQHLRLVKAGNVGSVRIVDTAVVPEDPVWPNRPVAIAGAALAGLVLGLAFAFAREFLFGGVATADEIEHATGLDVLASIPDSAAQHALNRRVAGTGEGPLLLADAWPGDAAIESLRSLRTALRFSGGDSGPVTVLMTGAIPGAGKSFTTANLGAVLAAAGKRVLIVDGDLRRGSLSRYLGARQAPGLAELIAGSADATEVLQRGVRPQLDFIAAGSAVGNPGELLMQEGVATLLDGLRAHYDHVLIDAPPLLAVDDAALLARLAAVVLLVVRAGDTRPGELRESTRRLARAGVRVSGAVLNGVPVRGPRSAYGGKYAGNYAGSYGGNYGGKRGDAHDDDDAAVEQRRWRRCVDTVRDLWRRRNG